MEHLKIIERLCSSGYPTYTVGGSIRDDLSGIDSSDYDITTKATPDEILALFPDRNTKEVGKSFGVVLIDGIEVATFRKDRHLVIGGARQCDVTYADTIFEDLSRRDLTINAIAICEKSGEIIDNNNGVGDLKNKIIRFVGDPRTRIEEDPCRILRSCRFVAKTEGKFEEYTLKALQEFADYVPKYVSNERVRAEILKAMQLPVPSLFFSALALTGVLKYILPELDKCVGHYHGVHHKEDIFEHSMIVGDSISPKFPLVRLAGYLHDIGKPIAFVENGDGSFIKHESIGERLVKDSLKTLKFSKEEVEKVAGLVRFHMAGSLTYGVSDRAIRRFRKKLADRGVDPREWLRVRIGDRKGNIKRNPFTLTEIRDRVLMVGIKEVEEEQVFSVKDLAINGNDIMERFEIRPCKLVGELLKSLLDFVVDSGGEFNNRVDLLSYSDGYLNGLK